MKITTFLVTHADGERFRWSFWRDPRPPAGWVLRTHDGCERELGATWLEAAPRIQAIAENYGVTTSVS